MNKILVIAPHPDDEVLGCGGLIHKLASTGSSVSVLVVTRGTPKLYTDKQIENVRAEARQAHALLGVEESLFLDFPAPELDTVPIADISRAFAQVIKDLAVEQLFIPFRGDIHNDHRVVFNAALVAARPVGAYTVKRIYAYETLSETEWAPPFGDDAFIPNHFVDISGSFQAKLDAMCCFKSQLRAFPSSRSLETIEALAKFRGATIGVERAEAFMTIRTIE